MRVALDAMGGDNAPSVTVAGAVDFLNARPGDEVLLVGDEDAIKAELKGKSYTDSRLIVIHASETIEMEESPLGAIRRKKDSSMARAFSLVKEGKADAVVSAGNSGAAMALGFLRFGKLPGVDRPAIATVIPVFTKPFVLLDAGANVDCTPRNLLQFAHMGRAYCSSALGRDNPSVALLSIGEEASKGDELTKESYKLLKSANVNFVGNVEGKDMFFGRADVVVCDGFAGNVVLKTSEGIAEGAMKMLRDEIKKTWIRKIGYLLLKPAFDTFRSRTDYAEYGGAPLLGVNGTCIIGHGRSTSVAISNALKVATDLASNKVLNTIAADIAGTVGLWEGSVAAD